MPRHAKCTDIGKLLKPELLGGDRDSEWRGFAVVGNRAYRADLGVRFLQKGEVAVHRCVTHLAVCASVLLVASSGRAAITDDGQVVLEPDGSLSIGSDAFGRRAVAGEADGAYPAASLGLLTGGHGELLLTGGASFETTGQLGVGGQGGAVLDVSEGSRLLTGSARLLDFDLFNADIADPIRARIAGSGTEWINGGLLQIGASHVLANIELGVSEGAHLESDGVWAAGQFHGFGRTEITVEGLGTLWNNTGELRLSDDASFTLRGGATAADSGVNILGSYDRSRGVVEGAGSLWRTGHMRIDSNSVALLVQDGGRVESTSAVLTTQTFEQAIVRGAGSAWIVAGRLTAMGDGNGGSSYVQVEQGGLLETGETQIGLDAPGSASVSVIGTGATFRNAGELLVAGGYSAGASFGVLGGAQATTKTMRVGCGDRGGSCEVGVSGAGSLLTVVEDAFFSSDPSNPDGKATWTVGAGGRVEIGQTFSVVDNARVSLADGTVSAAQLALQGGALTGDGLVQSIVKNAGLVAPGASIGHLTVDGSYTQDPDGALSIMLGGLAPGVSHDILEVLGASALGGTLRVELANGYLPNLGDSFQILSAASVSGTFDHYEGLELSPNLSLMVNYLPAGVRLVTVPVPEPGTAMLVSIGLAAAAALRRRPSRANLRRVPPRSVRRETPSRG